MIFALLSFQTPAPAAAPAPGAIDRLPGFFRDAGVIVGIGVFLLLLLMVWAKYIRTPARERSHSHSSPRTAREQESRGSSGSDEDGENGHHHHHRRRRHRRAHRSLNPTLAETGGLPPPRPDDETPRAT